MTDQIDTSPEAVERLADNLRGMGYVYCDLADFTIRALSAERDRNAAIAIKALDRATLAEEWRDHDKAEVIRLAAENAALREALTPSGDTKAEYAGEFSITVYDGEDEDGAEQWRKVLVDWTTIKAIMATIKARAALSASQPRKTDTNGV